VASESIRPVKKMAKKLLKNGVVDFIASDVHHNRKNYMQKAYNLIKKRYGEQTAEQLFNQNALQIIKGQA
jgi:protein-tyrosine phosphatase